MKLLVISAFFVCVTSWNVDDFDNVASKLLQNQGKTQI